MTDVATGEAATMRFSLGNATLTGAMRRPEAGTETFLLGANSDGGLQWLFIPYSEAAPTEDK